MKYSSASHRIVIVSLLSAIAFGSRAAEGADRVRIATYNASLYGKVSGQIRERLKDGKDSQAEKIAAIVQTVRPDILLVNEIDYDSGGVTAKLLAEKFLAVPQGDREAMDYPFVYAAPSNTGIDSELDLNNNRRQGEPNDAWGYGVYPGQYSMAVYSRYPIDERAIRTFQEFLWSDLPEALRPVDPDSGDFYYDEATWKSLRLSSKNHIDVPVVVGKQTIHVLASHPTPPVFDGPEDRNGCRNHDEIRFWFDFLASGAASQHLIDDQGRRGGVDAEASVVIMGDLNSDPADGDGRQGAIKSLLNHSRLQDPAPTSAGGLGQTGRKGQPRSRHGSLSTWKYANRLRVAQS